MSRLRPGRGSDSTSLEVRRASVTIGWQSAALLLAVLLVFAGLVVLMVVRGQQRQATSVLERAVAVAHGQGGVGTPGRRRDADDVLLDSVAVAVSDPAGLRIDGAMPDGLPDQAVMAQVRRTGVVDQRTVELDGIGYLVRTGQHGDDTVQAVLDLSGQRAELARLVQAMLVAGLTGTVLVAAVAALLTRRAVRPMAEALALQRRFVADAAHELRTPLTLLSTRAQLLARRARRGGGVVDGRNLDDLDRLVADAANLTALLEELLLAADLRSVPTEELDVTALAAEAVAAVDGLARERGVAVAVVADRAGQGSEPLLVRGSPPALLRAVVALLDNAVGHARSRVDVGVTRGTGRSAAARRVVELVVRDDGPGIDAAILPTMFDRFASSRPDGTERRHYGLGLSLVSEIVARHGGTVRALNRPDGGAEFLVRLPLAAAGTKKSLI